MSAAAAQEVLSIPVGADGELRPPPGVQLERTGVIGTLAGTGRSDHGGDGGPAILAQFSFPRSLALDPAGNIYVVDTRSHRIRRIARDGTISTFAGTGEDGDEGDGGPATRAQLCYPAAVAADAEGNVYVADSWNHRIRKIDIDGIITTVAGTGAPHSGGDGGPATEAQLAFPVAVALDPGGNLYVAESRSHRVRRIAPDGTITTFAGTGVSGYGGDGGPASRARVAYPAGIAVDPSGNLYIADSWNHRVRRILSSGVISTVAGTGERGDGGDGGPAVQAELAYPVAVASDRSGNLYVVSFVPDAGNHRIRKIDAGGTISAFAGDGGRGYGGDGDPAPAAQLSYPLGVAADPEGNVYIADSLNARVRVVRPGLQVRIPLGTSGETAELVVGEGGVLEREGQPVSDGSEVAASNGNSYALTEGPDGVVVAHYVPETQQVNLAGGGATLARDEDGTWRIDGEPVENGHRHLHLGREYVLELAEGIWGLADYTIETVAGTTDVAEGILAVTATFSTPTNVAADTLGNVYFTERRGYRVRRIDPAGTIATYAGTGSWGYSGDGGPATEARIASPAGMAVDRAGNLFVAERHGSRVRRIDSDGTISTFAGTGEWGFSGDGGPATEARLAQPSGIAVDTAGNVYVIDRENERLRRVDASGAISTYAGTGERGDAGDGGPAAEAELALSGVSVDSAGNVYLAQADSHRVRRIDSGGVISTLAGTGEPGYRGDGGPAAQAQLNRPRRVAADSAGNVYVVDARNNRIRRIDTTGRITTFAGTGEWGYSGDDGPAVDARLADPRAVAADRVGNLYVTSDARIRKIDTAGVITTLAGTGEEARSQEAGPALLAQFNDPTAVALSASGELFFADAERVWKLDTTGFVSPLGCCDGHIEDLAVGPAGSLLATLRYEHRISRIDVTGGVSTYAGTGEPGFSGDGGPGTEAQFNEPCGLAVGPGGDVYVADRDNSRIRRIDLSGVVTTYAGTGDVGYAGDGGPAAEAHFESLCNLAADTRGNLYLSDGWDNVRRIDAGGVITTIATIQSDVGDVAADQAGNVFIGSERQVLRLDPNGTISVIAGIQEGGYSGDSGPARSAGLSVSGLAVNRMGDVWIADGQSRRVRVLRRQRP